MRKALFILLLVSLLSFSQNVSEIFEEEIEASPISLLADWKIIAVAALFISGILVAIGYVIGMGMEMPELRAWAGNELVQVVSNAILIVILMIVIGFLDSLIMGLVNSSGVGALHCDVGDNCLLKSADFYISDYLGAAEDKAKDVLRNNMIASGWANRRVGIYCITIYCAQAGVHMALAPHYNLDMDRYMVVFSYYSGLIASLEAQRFFVNEISFNIGPLLLALGIVARSFFFTRRTGGLLIAIAAGIMFFFPMMYLFNWMTLDMTISGDNLAQQSEFACPTECSYSPASAYYGAAEISLNTTDDVYAVFAESDEEREKARMIIMGELEVATASAGDIEGQSIYSCNHPANGGDCPQECRDLPYASVTMCADPEIQKKCAELPRACKVARYVQNIDEEENSICSAECKIVPPMKSDCNFDKCLDSRLDCRVAKRTDLDWRPSVPETGEKATACNVYTKDCPADMDSEESCVWVFPETGKCDDICAGCPSYCRVEGADVNLLPDDCLDEGGTELSVACEECSSTCMLNIEEIEDLNPPAGECTDCLPEYRLVIFGGDAPDEYTTAGCSIENCSVDYRLSPPRSACEKCFNSESSYFYEPPINTECVDQCKPPNNVPSKDPADYSQVDSEGMVGTSEVRELSKLLIPAYLLPLFNITATLIFIRGFSAMIGGDIEIPGLSKVF